MGESTIPNQNMSTQTGKSKTFKNITRAVLSVLADMPRVLEIGFSRKSLTQKMMLMELGFDPFQINKTLKRLTKQEYLDKKLDEKSEKYRLAQKCIDQINFLKLESAKLEPQSKKWDGYWRVIIFDIPEEKRQIRNAFREKIYEWEFYKLQNSVFVYLFACEKEVGNIARILDIENCVLILKTKHLGHAESRVRRFFGIS